MSDKYWLLQHNEKALIFLRQGSQTFTTNGVGSDNKFHGWRVSASNKQPTCNNNSSSDNSVLIWVQSEHIETAKATMGKSKFYLKST
ncbi:hypothetical protein [Oligella sp. MSHR50489EDL]|uniref:hypothetical protein n=1 Tax=Oligella sp. MSHR50489EDL TaxID=3139409 RepID=UPI003D8149AE